MITVQQLREIAKTNNIQTFYQEKDYLQNVFLFNLFKKTNRMVFKGGTALKLAYNFARFSEDLDFNTALQPKKIMEIVEETIKQCSFIGIEAKTKKKELFKDAFSCKIAFKGPLYNGQEHSTNSIRIDAGKRTALHFKPVWIQVNNQYPDIPKYFALTMQKKEIFAEKIRAMYFRAKPRDFFDVWALSSEEKPSSELVEKKFEEAGKSFKKAKLHFCTEKEFNQDIKNIIAVRLPEFEQIKKEIKKTIKKMAE